MAAVDIIAEHIPETDVTTSQDTYTTKNGITLKIKPVPPMLIQDAGRRLKPPKVPTYYNKDKEVEEENPDDPDYTQALVQWNVDRADLVNGIILAWGTELVFVPESISPVDSDEWVEMVKEVADLDVPTSRYKRYYCWLKWVALSNAEDFGNLLQRAALFSGVTTEAAVAQAAEEFRNLTERANSAGVQAN